MIVYIAYMGTTKTNIYTEDEIMQADMMKALAHPARIKIFTYLQTQNGCICRDIVEEVGLSQSTVSQHLKVMKESGLIKGEIEGASTCYCVDSDALNGLKEVFADISTLKPVETVCC